MDDGHTSGLNPATRSAQLPVLLVVGVAVVLLALVLNLGLYRASQNNIPAGAMASEIQTVAIPIEGMSCMACAARVKRALKDIEGVREVEVSLERRKAVVQYVPRLVSSERLSSVINGLGYKARTPIAGVTTR